MRMSGPGRLPTLVQITDPQSIPASTRGWLNTTEQEASERDGREREKREWHSLNMLHIFPRVRFFHLFLSRTPLSSMSRTNPPSYCPQSRGVTQSAVGCRGEISHVLSASPGSVRNNPEGFCVYAWSNSHSGADLNSVVNYVSAKYIWSTVSKKPIRTFYD